MAADGRSFGGPAFSPGCRMCSCTCHDFRGVELDDMRLPQLSGVSLAAGISFGVYCIIAVICFIFFGFAR